MYIVVYIDGAEDCRGCASRITHNKNKETLTVRWDDGKTDTFTDWCTTIEVSG